MDDEDRLHECECCGFAMRAAAGVRGGHRLCDDCWDTGCDPARAHKSTQCPDPIEPFDWGEDDDTLCRNCGDEGAGSDGFCARCEAEMML